ncbi:unnamed protein product [Mycena citricolor]|uniref:AB hydrolase-1 domain-containing protein n=1 Tax=Mycena citricolor TaxID=2018698 RepID=A0AAD2H2S5_9AGAR|nr:unnamed protein product [Mycena citricolor]
MAVLGSGLVIIALTWGGVSYSWASTPVLITLISGLLLLLAFGFYEASIPSQSTIPLDVIANQTSLSSLFAIAAHAIASISMIYYLPVYFQACFGASPLQSALDFLPGATITAPFGLLAGMLITATKQYRKVNWIGWLIMIVAFGLSSSLKATASVGQWVGFQLLAGIGIGIVSCAPVFPLLAPLHPSRAASALALFCFTRSFFQTWGIAISGTILQNQLKNNLPATFVARFPPHFHVAFAVIPAINQLDQPLKSQVQADFASSMAVIWQVMTGTFPKDLQQHLAARIPAHLNIRIQSSLYPTYKSRKPIAFATQNFLSWLETQPPGPVILLAHSMGGLLAADAATTLSNTPDVRTRRILGVVNFDVPFLGMHPHVVVSGIASLFPDKEEGPSEAEMNKHKDVKIVDRKVTEDWEQSVATIDAKHKASSSSSSPPHAVPNGPSKFVSKTVNLLAGANNSTLGRWVRKHADAPFSAGMRFVTEYFQFGICMFDPVGLKTRYARLVGWPGGMWVNYWTEVPKNHAKKDALEEDSDARAELELVQNAMNGHASTDTLAPMSPSLSPSASGRTSRSPTPTASSTSLTSATPPLTPEKPRKPKHHHFIVLPAGVVGLLGGSEKWEKVPIGGVSDEVAGHCGLFIRGQNLDYDGLVQRVGARILDWCEVLR